jgi:hypothetical protein
VGTEVASRAIRHSGAPNQMLPSSIALLAQ